MVVIKDMRYAAVVVLLFLTSCFGRLPSAKIPKVPACPPGDTACQLAAMGAYFLYAGGIAIVVGALLAILTPLKTKGWHVASLGGVLLGCGIAFNFFAANAFWIIPCVVLIFVGISGYLIYKNRDTLIQKAEESTGLEIDGVDN